jgi:hypothetical protein
MSPYDDAAAAGAFCSRKRTALAPGGAPAVTGWVASWRLGRAAKPVAPGKSTRVAPEGHPEYPRAGGVPLPPGVGFRARFRGALSMDPVEVGGVRARGVDVQGDDLRERVRV